MEWWDSLGRGALKVELLKVDLHSLVGKRPGSAFCEEKRIYRRSPEGECALADMSLWIEEDLDNISYISCFFRVLVLCACPALMKFR